MSKRKLFFDYGLVIIILILSIFYAYSVYPIETTKDRVDFIVTVTSLIISFLAFMIAMRTFNSIDNVNRVTQLNGNVLENEQYNTSLSALFYDYDKNDVKQTKDEIFKKLESKFSKDSKTAIKFANNLQDFIDVIVFFPALFSSEESEENIKRMDNLFNTIEKGRDRFLSIGTGNLTLIEETVKLLKGVTSYQKLVSKQDFNVDSDLMRVRGTMLKNSVTQTVYYNYLGLFYNKKAMQLLSENIQLSSSKKDFFDIDNHRQLIAQRLKIEDSDLGLISIYLHESKNAFQNAIKYSQKDTMWEGFIKYNDARTTYFLQLLFPEDKDKYGNWQKLMDEAIIARKRLNMLINDVIERGNDSYLKDYFIYQEHLAKLVKINILIARNENITDFRGNIRYNAPSYENLLEDSLIGTPYQGSFKRIVDYQDKVKRFIQE